MPGRKRKPTRLHLLQGTAQPCRMNPKEPKAPAELPSVPYCQVSERCIVLFGMIISWLYGMRIASVVDTANITHLAMRLEEIEECNREIKERGRNYAKIDLIEVPEMDGNGKQKMVLKAQKLWKPNPAVAQRSEAMRHAQSLLAEFGLSPASRGKVSASSEQSKTDNSWESFLNG